jgi:hypothetical protein
MNTTDHVDYAALDELVRRARRERSDALGQLLGRGILASWNGARKVLHWIARDPATALRSPPAYQSMPHSF